MWGIQPWPVNSPHKGPVTPKMFPFDDVIMYFVVLNFMSTCVIIKCTCKSQCLKYSRRKSFWTQRRKHWRKTCLNNVYTTCIQIDWCMKYGYRQMASLWIIHISRKAICTHLLCRWSGFAGHDSKVRGPTWGPSGADRTQMGPVISGVSIFLQHMYADAGVFWVYHYHYHHIQT